jgi:hypothetical protein
VANGPFTFINLSGNENHTDLPINKRVRSHVMRESRRQKRLERRERGFRVVIPCIAEKVMLMGDRNSRNSPSPENFNTQTYASAADVAGEMELGAREARSQSEKSVFPCQYLQQSPFTPFGGSPDPFNVLSLPSSPRVMILLHQSTVHIRYESCSQAYSYVLNTSEVESNPGSQISLHRFAPQSTRTQPVDTKPIAQKILRGST